MSFNRLTSWLPLAGVLALVAGALVWLLIIFSGDQSGMTVPPNADVALLTDRGGRLGFEEVERLPSAAWRPRVSATWDWAAGGEALWVRVKLHNPTEGIQRGVLTNRYFFSDHVDAWVKENGTWSHLRSGEALSSRQRSLPGRDSAFVVAVPPQSDRVVYVRSQDYLNSFVWMVWWPEQADFFSARERELLSEGLYLGGLLALLGYNLLLWLRLRLPDIGFYVAYLGTNVIFCLITRALVPALGGRLSSPALEIILATTLALGGFALICFARHFLELKLLAPRADRLARWAGFVMLGLAAGGPLAAWTSMLMLAVVIMLGLLHAGLGALALWAWRAGARQARFFALSFGCLFAGTLPMVVTWLTRAGAQDSAFRGVMVGSALEMLLLSLATADRFARAQRRLVEETEQRRLIEETYADELEIEVRERTRDLEEANADKDRMLAVIGHDLRNPITGLMRSADDTPGEFAREAARTGRALLLLIEDLVLWARLRAGTAFIAVHPAGALLAPAVALHRSLAERGGTELIVGVPDGLRVETDLVLAQTLVRNLLANALKFARTRVALRAVAEAPGRVRLSIGNDGPALSAEIAARIASDEDGPMTATGGLGLRLCREICRVLGTKLDARTAADGGTEFGFTLPAVASSTLPPP